MAPMAGGGLAGARGKQGFLGHCLPPGHQAEGEQRCPESPVSDLRFGGNKQRRAPLQRAQPGGGFLGSFSVNLPRGFWGTGSIGPPSVHSSIIPSLLPSSCRHSIRPQLLAGGPGESQLLQHKPGDPGAEVHHLPALHQVSPAPLFFPLPSPHHPATWDAVGSCPTVPWVLQNVTPC